MNAHYRRLAAVLAVVVGSGCAPADDDGRGGGFPSDDTTGSMSTVGEASDAGNAGDDSGPPDDDDEAESSSTSEAGEVSGDASSASLTTTGGDATGGDDGSSSSSTGGPIDACDAYEPPTQCASRDGLDVYCVEPGATFEIEGRVSYGPGFPDGLPALGLGEPSLGYFPLSSPLTCSVHLCDTAETDGNSALSDGHICEATFPNGVVGETEGWSLYRVEVPLDAVEEDHLLGFNTNTGATVISPEFYLRIIEPEG